MLQVPVGARPAAGAGCAAQQGQQVVVLDRVERDVSLQRHVIKQINAPMKPLAVALWASTRHSELHILGQRMEEHLLWLRASGPFLAGLSAHIEEGC